jgi:hypothetical protein
MRSGVDGSRRHAMGLRKFSDGDTPVIGDLDGDIGDESRIADSAFAVEDPLVGSRFPCLNSTDDLVQLCFLQGRVPIDLFHRFFDFLKRFPSYSESANEIADRRHGVVRRG